MQAKKATFSIKIKSINQEVTIYEGLIRVQGNMFRATSKYNEQENEYINQEIGDHNPNLKCSRVKNKELDICYRKADTE